MHNVMIVDDETVVRSSLASILDWEALGYQVVASVANGKAALNMLQSQKIDVMFTDIKMPIMDGLQLLEELANLEEQPVVVVLSAYSEFELVRKAFRLGAQDYILKSDITAAYVAEILQGIGETNKQLKSDSAEALHTKSPSKEKLLQEMVFGDGKGAAELLTPTWCLACLEIDNFKKESLRFGDKLESTLVQPLLEFAAQIPRVASKCVICSISFSRYIILFQQDDAVEQARSICMQVRKVWMDYMNLSITGGISRAGTSAEDFLPLLQECYANLTLKYVFGPGGVFTPFEEALFDVKQALERRKELKPLLDALHSMNAKALFNSQQEIMPMLHRLPLAKAKIFALEIVYNMEMLLLDVGADLWNINNEQETDFYQKVSSFETTSDLELWVSAIIRWVTDFLEQIHISKEVDIMEKARRFITDHYADSGLSLATVAAHVGLNEKYFSTRFNKQEGKGFVAYLTELRIARAKQLILKTDMKMYEVSNAVGFASVEHFTRVFKKYTGQSPSNYHGHII